MGQEVVLRRRTPEQARAWLLQLDERAGGPAPWPCGPGWPSEPVGDGPDPVTVQRWANLMRSAPGLRSALSEVLQGL